MTDRAELIERLRSAVIRASVVIDDALAELNKDNIMALGTVSNDLKALLRALEAKEGKT